MTKPIWQSRTFWINVLGGAGTILAALNDVLPPEATPYVAAAFAVVNVGMRLLTNQPVSLKRNQTTLP